MSTVYTARGIAAQMGVTYRELDYWCTNGWLAPSTIDGFGTGRTPGSGNTRVWAGREVTEAVIFAKLVRIGFKPSKIGQAHKKLAAGQPVHLSGNLVLSVGEVSS